jgi:hypothetical protein
MRFFLKIVFLFKIVALPLHTLFGRGLFTCENTLFEIVKLALEAANQATVAQLVEQLICNQLVGGSSPSSGSLSVIS